MRDAVTDIKSAMEEDAFATCNCIAMEGDAFRHGDETIYWRIPCNSVKFWSQQERQWLNNDATMQGSKDSVAAGTKILNKQYLECRIEGFCESAMMRLRSCRRRR